MSHLCSRPALATLAARPPRRRPVQGFTLIEVLIATVITVILIGSLATLFGWVTDTVNSSRSLAEMNDRLRYAKHLLQSDLAGLTCPIRPPLNPDDNLGYFELVEGPIGSGWGPGSAANQAALLPLFWGSNTFSNGTVSADTTVGDVDDILMFTSRKPHEPFVGRWSLTSSTTSPVAEVCWFCTGSVLRRRVLLVKPGIDPSQWGVDYYTKRTFYRGYDVSMRQQGSWLSRHLDEMRSTNTIANSPVAMVRSNSLGDLTKRENRYSHQPLAFPHDMRWSMRFGGTANDAPATPPPPTNPPSNTNDGLPTFRQSTADANNQEGWIFPMYESPAAISQSLRRTEYWPLDQEQSQASKATFLGATQFYISPDQRSLGSTPPLPSQASGFNANYEFKTQNGPGLDMWSDSADTCNQFSNYANNGLADEDIVLRHVLSFDVKVWDPGAPIFRSTTTNSAGQDVAITPEDPGYLTFQPRSSSNSYYIGALQRFVNSPTTAAFAPIAFGSYVDLNYMCTITSASGTTSAMRTADYVNRYETQLRVYEGATNLNTLPRPLFNGPGNPLSGINRRRAQNNPNTGAIGLTERSDSSAIYDTWSTHYESDGIDQDANGVVDQATNGVDDPDRATWEKLDPVTKEKLKVVVFIDGPDDAGELDPVTKEKLKAVVFIDGPDDAGELEAPPPYRDALRGIQVRIRCFEPVTRQIREVTLTHEFLEE